MRAKKSLGQNFLTTQSIARDIVNAGSVKSGDTVLEIGPGKGMLTKELLKRGASIIAVEKDRTLAQLLKEHFMKEVHSGQLSLLTGDIRDVDLKNLLSKTRSYKIVANIPYYITGELIRLFITAEKQPSSITLLVQKEVAERIARDTKGSILSMSIRAYGSPHYIKTVSKKHFKPSPKVNSAVLVISDISKKRFVNLTENHFFEVLKVGFSKKRKKLLNNLGDICDRAKIQQSFDILSLQENVRAEELTIDQWIALSKSL